MATITQSFPVAAGERATRNVRGSLISRIIAALQKSREEAARREIARQAHLVDALTRRAPVDRNELPF